jgi:WD40 repeat protein
MTRGRLAPFALLLVAACIDNGPPAWAPNPRAGGPPTEACLRAKKLRERAPALFEAGHLDRTVRVLQRAEDLCTVEAPATWALRVRALAAIGRSAEALQLVARIERSDRAGDPERAAASLARAQAEAHGRLVVERGSRKDAPELFDPDEKRRAEATALFQRAASLSRAGEHGEARKLFLSAWEAWHPNPRALVEAGMEARLAGANAEAQALWDRAVYDDATLGIRPELSSGAPASHAGRALAWSSDGARLAVGGDDEAVVYDADLHPTLRLRTKEPVLALAFAADGGRLFAGLDGALVRVFDAVTGAAERDLVGHRGPVRVLAASSDRRIVASAGDDGTVRLWDADAGVETRTLKAPRGATLLAFDAAGAMLAGAGEDGRVVLWDTRSGAVVATLPARGGAVKAMALDGAALDVVTAGERTRWDLTQPRRPRPTTAGRVKTERASIAVRAGGALVAALAGEEIGVGDLAGGAPGPSSSATAHEGVAAFALAPGGAVVAAVYGDRTLAILPAGERREPRVIAPAGPVEALAVTRDGKTLAAAVSGRALLWRAEGERLRALDPGQVRALAFSPDGRTLAMGAGKRVALHDLAGQKPDVVVDAAGAVECLGFSPDGTRVVAGTAAPSVQIFAPGAAIEPRSLALEAGPVRAARFSPDGASVLVASREGLTLWNPAAREGLRFVPYGPETRDAVFTPDGAGMVVANVRGELLFGKPAPTAPAPTKSMIVPTQVVALAISSDGTIATAEGDRAVGLRSPVGKSFQRFRDPDAAVRAVAFLPAHVAAGLADGSLRLHHAPAVEPVATLRLAPGLPPGKLGGVVSGPLGHFEIVGPDAEAARAALRCRLGPALYPLEVCADQFAVEGLLSIVMAGKDPAEADP